MASVSNSNRVSTPRKLDEWTNVTKTGIVLFPFNATHKFQLPLSVGDFVQIHAQTSQEQIGWYSGVSVTTQESGIFPQSFVVVLPEQSDIDDPLSLPNHIPICSKLNLANEEMTNSSIVNEITSTIVEWATLLKIYSTSKLYNEFKILSQKISQLVQFRNQILSFKSPKDISFDLRDRILMIIDEGRRETGMSIVLRKEIPNTYSIQAANSSAQSNSRSSITILPTVATDLILADAENTGVFTLCTMYQEKKLEINSFRDSFEYDSLEINNNLAAISASTTNNVNNSNNNSIVNSNNNNNNNNIGAVGGLPLSTNNILNGANVILSQSPNGSQQSPNSSSVGQSPISSGQSSPTNSSSNLQNSPSNSNNILGSSMNGVSPLSNSTKDMQPSNHVQTSSSPSLSQSQTIQQPQPQFSSSPSNNSFLSTKLIKQGSSKNFLSNVLLKSKGSSSSLSMSGSMMPSNNNGSPNGLNSSNNNNNVNNSNNNNNSLSNSSSGIPPNGMNNGGSPSSSSMVSSSYISVTSQSPSSISSPNNVGSVGNGSGSNLNSSLSSLNLNSPILSNSPSKKMQTIKMKSRSFLLNGGKDGSSTSIGGVGSNSTTALGVNGEFVTKFNSQLLISLNNFLYSSGEYIDIVLSIFNRSENKFLTESYCGVVPPSGIFVEPENPNERIRAIFRDLETKDLNSDLYLVVKLYRKTNSLSSKDPNSSPTLTRSNAMNTSGTNILNGSGSGGVNNKLFRKFVGVGVKKLDLSIEGVSELMITLNTTSNENSFYNLHETIMNEQSTLYEPITRAKGVVFTCQLFTGDYQQFLQECPDFRSITTSLKLQLPEVVLPGGDRNDMYVQLEEGDFSDKNVEVQMMVRTESGQIIHDAIKFSNGQSSTSEYKSPMIPSSTLVKWNEIIKIWVAAKTFEKSHLFFLFRQCSEKKDKERQTIGFGYLKFTSDEGAVIKDQQYTISMYKCNSTASDGSDIPVSYYINGVVENEKSSHKSQKKLDSIKIRTTFVSNCLTQNPSVVNLSRWQSYSGDLSSLIKDITFLGANDLVRNLQEIFYNFLSILDQQLNDSPLSMEIFRSIVFIIGVLVESRTSNYRPALDLYASKYFGTPLTSSNNKQDSFTGITAHSHLLRSVVKNLENFETPANASKISSSLKALEYIFKLVVASKTKFGNKETIGNESYQTNLKSVVDILCEIMLSNTPSLIGAKTIALKNFESMFTDLKQFFTVEEMGIIALKFMKSIQHDEKKKTFSILKLKLLSSYINGPMMLCKETRKQLLPLVFQLLYFHFGKSSEETDMCLMILGLIVDIMITKSELRGKDKDPWLMEMLHFFVPILELLQLLNNGGVNTSSINSITTTTTTTTTTTSTSTTSTTTSTTTTDPNLKSSSSSSSIINSGVTGLLLAQMVSTMSEENQNNLRIKIYAFILGTARLSGVQHWEMINKSITPTNKNFFIDLYDSLQLIFESPKFPSDFWTFTVFQLKTILRMTRILEDVIFYLPTNQQTTTTTSVNNGDNGTSATTGGSGNNLTGQSQFEFPQWRSFFLLTSSYLNCKDLQFESVNPAKAVFIKTRCGDVRIEMARVFERVWATVPIKERSTFIPVLIGPIVKLSISDTLDAKRVATKIFYDMLESEIIQTESCTELFYNTIDSLLEISTERTNRKGWPIVCRSDGKLPFTMRSFSTFFNAQCMSLVLSKSSDAIKKKSEQFILDINQFLLLITTFINDVKNGDEEEIFSSVSKLLSYLQEHKRTAQFIRFVHMTSRRHYEIGNYIEAAVTLQLHASLYQWDANKVVAPTASEYGSFPEQKESERKELLYKEILLCFNNGKAWDRAIPLVKELIHHFTMNICDMNSAATYLRQQGTFYQKINESADPVFEDYFRVGYYGRKFPSSIQNKEFIYKGNQFDRLSDFISKIQDKWPNSQLLKTTDVPSKEIQDSDGQYLLITTANISNIGETQKRNSVNAESITNKKRVPHRVQQFNARNKVNVFVYSKPFKKNAGATKSQNEFEDLWVMNLYFVCESSFPCTERRCLIVERKQVEISPIENALNSIVQKNDELAARIDRHQANTQESISPLTMLLNGIIDASVNGGVSRYETFMGDDYLKQFPEYKNVAELLKSALDQQLVIVEQGLKLHAQLHPPEMAAMQNKLDTFFVTMKNSRQKL